jgi:hypothetical protein
MIKKVVPQMGDGIKKTEVNEQLRFSFKYFTHDDELSPQVFAEAYLPKLLERLKGLSSWTLKQFTGTTVKAIRNHSITWSETSRPNGFTHLPEQIREGNAWQFSISANEHGRVHGLLVGSTFYVVWLDCNHNLYPQR